MSFSLQIIASFNLIIDFVFNSFLLAGTKSGSSIFNIASTTPAPVRKTATDDFLNSDTDKNDYDWYIGAFEFFFSWS